MARILVADDSLIVRKSYESMLSFMGHEVILCKDGQEAVQKFFTERPELVILDVDMPGMDGLEACREIRRRPDGLSVPIIIVSALDEENDILKGLNAGANDYLVKPVKEAHLMAKLKTSLGISALHKHDFELVKNKTVFVGKYRIERLLGYGAHSAVFLASDLVNGEKPLALKLLKESFASEDVAAPLMQGARRLMTIDSPYVVKIYDIGQFQDRVYMVMELADGGSLQKMLKTKRMNELEATVMAYDVVRGIKALDNQGIVHLDIKPGNVLFSGNFKLADFGVVVPRDSATMPLNAEIWSTAAYIAPEYLTLESELSVKSDIYSLGITIYQAITGDNPFEADRPSVGMFRQVNLNPPPLTDFNPQISPYLSDTVAAMLDKNPANRPSAVELCDVFQSLLEYLKQREAQRAIAGVSHKIHDASAEVAKAVGGIGHVGEVSAELEESVMQGRLASEDAERSKKMISAQNTLDNLAVFKRIKKEREHIGDKKEFLRFLWEQDRGSLFKMILLIAGIAIISISIGVVGYRIFSGGGAPDAVVLGPMEVVICQKCGFTEQKRVKNINKVSCSKCGSKVGYCMKCAKCGVIFPRPHIANKQGLSTKEYEKLVKDTYKCPRCSSRSIYNQPLIEKK
jgi:serine/threonine-protein kinase